MGSSRGGYNGAWGRGTMQESMAVWGGICDRVADKGNENVWFSEKRMNSHRGGGDQISGVWGKVVVQGLSVFVGRSCTAVVSLQHSSQQERNLISCFLASIDHREQPMGPDHPKVTSQWPHSQVRWRPMRRERVKGYGWRRHLIWRWFDWCSVPQHFCYS